MAVTLKPIRRVVTGNNERGQSRVVWDGAAPNAKAAEMIPPRGCTDLWVWGEMPAILDSEEDFGNLPYDFPGPLGGGHLRVVQSQGKPDPYDPAHDTSIVPLHEPKGLKGGRRWDRGGNNAYSSGVHKTESVDYVILLEGERTLVLDDREVVFGLGDIIVQVGAWHQWKSLKEGGLVAYDMMSAHFVDGAAGLAQGGAKVMQPDPARKLPFGIKGSRRIVTIDREPGKSSLVCDGPTPDVRIDAARPGFSSARIWVTDSTPAKIVAETLHIPHTLEPPANGSVLRTVTIPPDDAWKGKVGSNEVKAYFHEMGSPGASMYTAKAPHPYMQKTRSLDFVAVIKGEIVLVLDTEEVCLKAGDFVIQRGTSHAWSNRSGEPALLAIASHDGRWSR
ncbi:MAG: cupin domain-containing protein [Betaproteobacteria bacterium]